MTTPHQPSPASLSTNLYLSAIASGAFSGVSTAPQPCVVAENSARAGWVNVGGKQRPHP